MPGVVGCINMRGDGVSLGLAGAMRDIIRHQDWYHVDNYVSPTGTCVISRVHLGIINEEVQPYCACDGAVKIFLHGEIYSDEGLETNSFELIYQQYQEKGLDFASSLNGSYIIIIIDETKHLILMANDRLATKPLFYFTDGQTLYFGPEIKSVLLVPSLKRRFSYSALTDFLTNGQFTQNHTLIEGIESLDSATVLKISPDGITHHKYWNYELETGERDLGEETYQAELAELIRRAVQRRLHYKRTYGVLVSGGYDSRGILGCYLEQRQGESLQTISWGRQEKIPHSDCLIASRLAQKLGAEHRFYKLSADEVIENFQKFVYLGEGLTWFAESYDVFQRIKEDQGVDILLRGDECFGWEGLLVHDEHTMFRRLNVRALQYIEPYRRLLKPAYYQQFCALDAENIERISARYSAQKIHNRKDYFYVDIRLKHFINPLNYVKTFQVESLTPLLDYDLLDFVSALPLKYRLSKILYRKTITAMFPALFEEMAQNRNDIDWGHDFQNSPLLQRFIRTQLLDKDSILNEFIDPDCLRQELEVYFGGNSASRPIGLKDKMRTQLLRLSDRSPALYNLAHRSLYYGQKWLGEPTDRLQPEHLILRLLILKVWGDVFFRNLPRYSE